MLLVFGPMERKFLWIYAKSVNISPVKKLCYMVYIHIRIILVNELEKLHHKHGIRPDVFGDSEGEHEIEILTGEITQVKTD